MSKKQEQSNDNKRSAAPCSEEATIAVNMERRRGARGRASRRRRRKHRDIHAAEQAIRLGLDTNHTLNYRQGTESSCLPSDRNRVWPAVLEHRRRHSQDESAWFGEEDECALVSQLGYLPGNVIRIPTRVHDVPCLITNNNCDDDKKSLKVPVVVQLYPLVVREECDGGKSDGRRFKSRKRKRMIVTEDNRKDDDGSMKKEKTLIEPFPTMYWLTHPALRVMISKLELEAFGVHLEKRLASDTEAMKSMQRAHQAYGQERYSLLTDADQMVVEGRRWHGAIDETRGIAGISNPAAVKCLHAHAAHYLSGDRGSIWNVVGKWVMEAVAESLSGVPTTMDVATQR